MAIAAMVKRSGLVAWGKHGGLDAAIASLASLAAMRCILAADSIHALRALQTATSPTIIFALISNPDEQFGLRKSDDAFANARSQASQGEHFRSSLGTGLEEVDRISTAKSVMKWSAVCSFTVEGALLNAALI